MAIVALGQFGIYLKDRVTRTINYTKFNTPIKFVVEIVDVVDYVLNCIPPSYQHGDVNFQFSHEKKLSHCDVTSEFFGELFTSYRYIRKKNHICPMSVCQCLHILGFAS